MNQRTCTVPDCDHPHHANGVCNMHYLRIKCIPAAAEVEPIAPDEQWRPIPGYEATYLVSSYGRVQSVRRPKARGGLLSIKLGKRGYPTVTLVQNGAQRTREVHGLLAAAFLGERAFGQEVRHLDGNPLNCALANLAYGSRSENQMDKQRHGTDHNRNKTHCPKGHPYDEANTRLYQGRRYCKACASQRTRKNPDYRSEWRVDA